MQMKETMYKKHISELIILIIVREILVQRHLVVRFCRYSQCKRVFDTGCRGPPLPSVVQTAVGTVVASWTSSPTCDLTIHTLHPVPNSAALTGVPAAARIQSLEGVAESAWCVCVNRGDDNCLPDSDGLGSEGSTSQELYSV